MTVNSVRFRKPNWEIALLSNIAFASEINDEGAPVDSIYYQNEQLQVEEQEKSELAEKYYSAKISGNSEIAASENSHMPGYPSYSVNHWLAIYGYASSGATIYVVDPAKSSYVSWGGDISAKYTVSSTKMAAYASARGIIW